MFFQILYNNGFFWSLYGTWFVKQFEMKEYKTDYL